MNSLLSFILQAKKYYLVLTLFIGCSFFISKTDDIYYLHESIDIICQLIKTGRLGEVLDDANECSLELLIKNYSPAIMALESEVLNCTLPVIIYFYREHGVMHKNILEMFTKMAHEYDDKVKFVAVDIEKVPAMVARYEIRSVPAFSCMKQKKEIYFVEKALTDDELYALTDKLL